MNKSKKSSCFFTYFVAFPRGFTLWLPWPEANTVRGALAWKSLGICLMCFLELVQENKLLRIVSFLCVDFSH